VTIRELAALDNTAILDMDGDVMTLTSPTGERYTLNGEYIRRGTDIDPGTGLQVATDVSVFTVSLGKLSELGLPDPEDLRKTGWTIEATDVTGHPVRARLNPAMLDRTIGRATFTAKV
jgi:hypothetical protein